MQKKSIGSPLLPCSFSPTSTIREKPLSSSREAVIAPADIKNLHRSYAGIFCPRCKYMQSACLFVSSLRFAPLRVIIFKLQPQCLDHSTNSVSHSQRQNGTKIVHYEKCAGVSTKEEQSSSHGCLNTTHLKMISAWGTNRSLLAKRH